MKAVLRASRIGRVILRYRLDDLLQGTPAERWLRLAKPFVPRASADIAAQSRGARLRLALQDLGPIFVKFGQILSTRRDLVPPDVANELTLLQDRVKPFDGDTARRIVEEALGLPVSEAFASFDTEPLASASIAQVHAATLADGRQVVVKVLRPGIEKQIDADIALLNSLAALVERTHPRADKIRLREVVAEVENTLAAELDLQREGANASVLRRFWENSDDLYVPEVIWSHTAERALTLERVWGIRPTTSLRSTRRASTAKHWPPRACGSSTPRCSATTSSMPMRTPATSGSTPIRAAAPTRDSSRWTSASWASCRRRISTTWLRTSWPSSTAITAASPNCTCRRGGCRSRTHR